MLVILPPPPHLDWKKNHVGFSTLFFIFWNKFSLCSQASLELIRLLSQPPWMSLNFQIMFTHWHFVRLNCLLEVWNGTNILDLSFIFILCLWMFWLHVNLYTMWVSDTHGDQKRMLDALELDLHMVVSHHVGAGNWTQVLWKNSKCP